MNPRRQALYRLPQPGYRWNRVGCNRYNSPMVHLTEEQRTALLAHPEGIECEDALTRRVYVLVDADVHRRAMEALQSSQDLAAIQSGLEDVAAGRVLTVEQSRAKVAETLSRLQQ
jgi:predicted transcriptional regulator